jgi:hypothetical protein
MDNEEFNSDSESPVCRQLLEHQHRQRIMQYVSYFGNVIDLEYIHFNILCVFPFCLAKFISPVVIFMLRFFDAEQKNSMRDRMCNIEISTPYCQHHTVVFRVLDDG